MAIKGLCSGCNDSIIKTVYYALGTPWQHCRVCHDKGYRKGHGIHEETQAEYFARLAKKLDEAPPPRPFTAPPPRSQTPIITATTDGGQITPGVLKRMTRSVYPKYDARGVKSSSDLEQIRQMQKQRMHETVAQYQRPNK